MSRVLGSLRGLGLHQPLQVDIQAEGFLLRHGCGEANHWQPTMPSIHLNPSNQPYLHLLEINQSTGLGPPLHTPPWRPNGPICYWNVPFGSLRPVEKPCDHMHGMCTEHCAEPMWGRLAKRGGGGGLGNRVEKPAARTDSDNMV